MRLAFTFDDGPGRSTSELLDVLRAQDCHATFFILGENVNSAWWSDGQSVDPIGLLTRALTEGHLLGNHTMTHDGRCKPKQLVEEIVACDALLTDVYKRAGVDVPSPIPFRLPYGIRTFVCEYMDGGKLQQGAALDNRMQPLASMGRSHVHWTAILPDWQVKNQTDADCLYEMGIDHIAKMNELGLDVVFAMHDGRQRAPDATISDESFTPYIVDRLLTQANKRRWQTMLVPEIGF